MEKVIFKFWVERNTKVEEYGTICTLTLKVVPDYISFGRESPWFGVVDDSWSKPNSYKVERGKPGFRIAAISYEIIDEQSDKDWKEKFKFRADDEDDYFDLMIYGRHDDIKMDLPKTINED